ncbi:hypothetical protein P8935_23390 [Telmatobacter sp. DSM 110680]|uniref:Glycine zipper domain-containing protein n=1 Tax=Telmatobacter sp. DSM 110680 TaxID=3036704 RepID=A0AAU7DJH2_9BACT
MRSASTNCTIPVLLMFYIFTAAAQSLPQQDVSQATPQAQSPASATAPTHSSEDWNRLRGLVHQEEINVWASRNRHVRCLFSGATENYLFCEPLYSYRGNGEFRFDRADVDKVRLEQGERNFKRTIAVSAGVGAVTMAAATNTSNGGDRLLGALAGGLAGSLVGIIIAGPVALLTPGHLVYQRPPTHKKFVSAHLQKESTPQEAQ